MTTTAVASSKTAAKEIPQTAETLPPDRGRGLFRCAPEPFSPEVNSVFIFTTGYLLLAPNRLRVVLRP
jgi:hypothetical protein